MTTEAPIHADWNLNQAELAALNEAVNDRLLSLAKVRQWVSLTNAVGEEDGPTLELLKEISPTLREMAATTPWHVRGAQLRHAYIFGRGVNYGGVEAPRYRRILADPHNKAVAFSAGAYEVANLALFTDGNYFLLKSVENGYTKFTVVPLRQISGVSTDPDDPSSIWFIRRSWTSIDPVTNRPEEKILWYPLARYKARVGAVPAKIGKDEVSSNTVIYHQATRKQSGWTWGVPDSLAAMVWTEAYTAYLRNNAMLVQALSKIAWTISNSTPGGAGSSAATIRDSGEGVGGVASLANGQQLQNVGVPSAQVNMNNGQPLIAAVATSMGVPVIALLSSPGDIGGNKGSAQTLDEPTVKGMAAVQDTWTTHYEEVLHDLGATNATVDFPSIQTDPAYRQIASINQAQQLGSIHRDEARAAILDIADITKLHDDLPKPDGFNKWKDPDAQADAGGGNDPLARQGNSGSVPGGLDMDAPDHDEDE